MAEAFKGDFDEKAWYNLKIKILDDIRTIFENLVSTEVAYNFSPILHRYMGLHTGVKFTGKFKTNDPSENGNTCYTTFWRSENYAIPHDGVGMGWVKGDGNTYNVYIVDNDTLSNEIFAGSRIVREDLGINKFIASGKKEILIDTWYEFSLKIKSDNSIIAKVWNNASGEPADDAGPGAAYIIVRSGASGTAFREGTQEDYQFGIGIHNTNGGEWLFDDLQILAIDSAYPYSLFKFKATPSSFTGPATFKYYGYGFDEVTTYGLTTYLLTSGEQWINIGSNSATAATAVEDTEIMYDIEDITDYRNVDGYVYAASRPNGTVGEKNLNSYYTSLENIMPSGIHTGNMIDVWIDAPAKIVEEEVSINSVTGIINITDVDFNTPLQEIVEIIDSGDTSLTYSDWAMTTTVGSAFSTEPLQYITLGGSYTGVSETFTIRSRYYQDGPGVQNLLYSNEYRTPGAVNLVKIKPPHVVQIDLLDYRGLLTEDQVKEHIKDFVYAIEDSVFEVTDLLAYLYAQGVTYVNLNTLAIKIRSYNYKNIRTSGNGIAVTSSYSFSGVGSFYTHNNDLLGVTKLV
jgi:hypothetical protein